MPPSELRLDMLNVSAGTLRADLHHNGRKGHVVLVLIAHKPTPSRNYCSDFFPIPHHGFPANHGATLESRLRLKRPQCRRSQSQHLVCPNHRHHHRPNHCHRRRRMNAALSAKSTYSAPHPLTNTTKPSKPLAGGTGARYNSRPWQTPSNAAPASTSPTTSRRRTPSLIPHARCAKTAN